MGTDTSLLADMTAIIVLRNTIFHVVEQVNYQYGEIQDSDCRDLIETWLDHESVLGLGLLQCQHVRIPAKGEVCILMVTS